MCGYGQIDVVHSSTRNQRRKRESNEKHKQQQHFTKTHKWSNQLKSKREKNTQVNVIKIAKWNEYILECLLAVQETPHDVGYACHQTPDQVIHTHTHTYIVHICNMCGDPVNLTTFANASSGYVISCLVSCFSLVLWIRCVGRSWKSQQSMQTYLAYHWRKR